MCNDPAKPFSWVTRSPCETIPEVVSTTVPDDWPHFMDEKTETWLDWITVSWSHSSIEPVHPRHKSGVWGTIIKHIPSLPSWILNQPTETKLLERWRSQVCFYWYKSWTEGSSFCRNNSYFVYLSDSQFRSWGRLVLQGRQLAALDPSILVEKWESRE